MKRRPLSEEQQVLLEVREYIRRAAPKKKRRAPLFRDFVDGWFSRYCRSKKRSPGTLAHRRNCLRLYLLPPLRYWRMDAMGEKAVDAIRAHMQLLGDSTRNDALVILGMILRAAQADGWLDRLPPIELATIIRAKRRVHDLDGYVLVVKAARRLSWRHHLAVLLCGDVGMRRSEVAGLEWIRVDLEAQTVDIVAQAVKAKELWPPKHNECRTVAMTMDLFEALTRAKKRAKSSRVIPSIHGHPMGGGAIYHLVRAATRAALEEASGPHLLRHTMASHAVDAGASITAVQTILGHRGLEVTSRYLHSSAKTVHDAIRLLDARRSKQKP